MTKSLLFGAAMTAALVAQASSPNIYVYRNDGVFNRLDKTKTYTHNFLNNYESITTGGVI